MGWAGPVEHDVVITPILAPVHSIVARLLRPVQNAIVLWIRGTAANVIDVARFIRILNYNI